MNAGNVLRSAGPSVVNTGPNIIKTGPNIIKTGPNIVKTGPTIVKTGPNIIKTGPVNRYIYGGPYRYGGPPVKVRYYGFTLGLPYAFVYNGGYFPGYYTYLYGPNWGVGFGGAPPPYYVYGGAPPYNPYATTYVAPSAVPPGGQIVEGTVVADSGDRVAAARSAMRAGRYEDAITSAARAAEANPEDPAVHELMSQAMFALGDYRGAAIEAHAVLYFGQQADWQTVYNYYGNAETYTGHLRSLEEKVKSTPDDAATVFLLGYQYSMLGHTDRAAQLLAKATELAPEDAQAKQMLASLTGNQPTPADPQPTPAVAEPTPANPQPASVVAQPAPARQQPRLTGFQPTPADPQPIPAEQLPAPPEQLPTPADSQPIPVDQLPSIIAPRN